MNIIASRIAPSKNRKAWLTEPPRTIISGSTAYIIIFSASPTCPPPPTDIGYTMSLYVNDTQTPAWTQDVTGCVIGDAQSMPAQVMKLLQ